MLFLALIYSRKSSNITLSNCTFVDISSFSSDSLIDLGYKNKFILEKTKIYNIFGGVFLNLFYFNNSF